MSGGGGGGGLSKLGTALIIIFVVSLAALLAEVFYVLWRRRVFRRRTNPVGGGAGDQFSLSSSSDSTSSPIVSSKELLYFLCIRPYPRLDHNSVIANTAATDLNSNQRPDVEVIDIDLMKIQGMFGPPRFLFTIKEEEKEGLESPAGKSLCPPAERIGEQCAAVSRMSLEDCFESVAEESDVAVAVEVDGGGGIQDATPFSTPCASPVYFTPWTSPVHDLVNAQSTEEGRSSSESKTSAFRRPEV